MVPGASTLARFAADLDRLAPADWRLGLAVSGGPDSLALLLLGAAGRSGHVECATVDHGLRSESGDEAQLVASVCARLAVPHTTLRAEWPEPPRSAVQEQARTVRYRVLGAWLRERRLDAIVTAHHLDDQAETVLMRLNRGAGVRGLAGMRASAPLPDASCALMLRPLLGWKKAELEMVCAQAGVPPVADPANSDPRFERARIRAAVAAAPWLEPHRLAASAAHLAQADQALDWAVEQEWSRSAIRNGIATVYRPGDAPPEIRRRIVARAILELASEGDGKPLRGAELDRLTATLAKGGTATLRGVHCHGGNCWRFEPAPPRRPV